MRVLQLSASLFADQGVSSQLGRALMARINATAGGWQVIHRDFSRDPIPHLDGQWLAALGTPASERDDHQARQVAYSDQLIAELQQADLLVIAAPMYNFTLPSMLKAWIDHVARAGVTFRYTDKGAQGLVTGKRVVVIATMGGRHEPGASDHLRPYLRTVLGFLGMTAVDFIVADGLNLGAVAREQSLREAHRQIDTLAAQLTTLPAQRSAA